MGNKITIGSFKGTGPRWLQILWWKRYADLENELIKTKLHQKFQGCYILHPGEKSCWPILNVHFPIRKIFRKVFLCGDAVPQHSLDHWCVDERSLVQYSVYIVDPLLSKYQTTSLEKKKNFNR